MGSFRTKSMVLLAAVVSTTALAQTNFNSVSIHHRFLAVDDGTHTLVYVDENNPTRNWSVETGYVMDMQLVATNRVLLDVDDGYREYDLSSGKLLLSVKGEGGKAFSVLRIAGDRTLLTGEGLGGQKGASLMVYDSTGKIIERKALKSVTWPRHIRPTATGTFLLASVGQIVELDQKWNITWRAQLAGNLFKTVQLTNGNVLCSSGPGARFLKEVNRQGKVVREIRGDELKEGSFTGFDLRPDGHVVVANWLGHGSDHNGTVLVEFDRDGKVVWRYGRPHASFVEVLVLDADADKR